MINWQVWYDEKAENSITVSDGSVAPVECHDWKVSANIRSLLCSIYGQTSTGLLTRGCGRAGSAEYITKGSRCIGVGPVLIKIEMNVSLPTQISSVLFLFSFWSPAGIQMPLVSTQWSRILMITELHAYCGADRAGYRRRRRGTEHRIWLSAISANSVAYSTYSSGHKTEPWGTSRRYQQLWRIFVG